MAKWIAAFAMAAALAGAGGARAQLQGVPRQNFLNSAYPSCVASQQKAPANQGISLPIIQGYCRCSGGYMADRVNLNQLIMATGAIRRGERPPWLVALGKDASKYCLDNLSQYVPKPPEPVTPSSSEAAKK